MKEKSVSLTARIRNIGPMASFELTLPGPGLHLLVGPPESGKSTIERALTLAAMEDPKRKDAERARVEVSWDAKAGTGRGLPEGQILLPGMTGGAAGVTLRSDGKVTRLSDPPAVTLLAGDRFAALTRHGLVGAKERDAAELRTFAEITGITATPADLVPAEHAAAFADLAEGALSAVAEEVRKRGHALKARALDDAAALERKVNVLRDSADMDAAMSGAPSVEVASLALRQAEEDAARLRIERRGRIRAEAEREQHRAIHPATRPSADEAIAKAAEARAALDRMISEAGEGLPPEPDVEAARLADVNADKAHGIASDTLADIRERIAALQRQEATAIERLSTASATADAAKATAKRVEAEHAAWKVKAEAHAQRSEVIAQARRMAEDAAANVAKVEAQAREWDAREAVLSSPVEGPEQETADAATQAAETAAGVLAMAKRAEAEAKRAAEEAEQAEAMRKAEALGATFEAIATTGLRAKIRAVLEAADVTGWGISDDGALLCADPARGGELVPFGSLSGSTKDAAAMRLILAHAGEVGPSRYLVMLLPQEVADGMVPEQIAGLSRLAEERGVYIVGGKVGTGDLRVETVGK